MAGGQFPVGRHDGAFQIRRQGRGLRLRELEGAWERADPGAKARALIARMRSSSDLSLDDLYAEARTAQAAGIPLMAAIPAKPVISMAMAMPPWKPRTAIFASLAVSTK